MDWGGLLLLVLAALLIAYAIHAIQTFELEAASLNLWARSMKMAKIGDSFTASIAPATVGGVSAVVTDVVYAVDPAVYDIVVAADFLSALVTARAAGSSTVRVTAKSLGGVVLVDEKPLPDVVAEDFEAVALNLTVA